MARPPMPAGAHPVGSPWTVWGSISVAQTAMVPGELRLFTHQPAPVAVQPEARRPKPAMLHAAALIHY